MAKRLDPESKEILEFRPNITFIEPEVQPGEIRPVDEPQLEDINTTKQQVKKLAKAVDVLATAIQAKVDDKAKGMAIAIDPNIDIAVIQAMQRRFPDEFPLDSAQRELPEGFPEDSPVSVIPLKVTYDQYKQCKDEILLLGVAVGRQAIISPEEVAAVKDDAAKANRNEPSLLAAQMGGFGTPEAENGGLRPELQKRGQIIKPIEIQKLQVSLICILVNFIWKNFILPVFKPIGIPGLGSIADALPKKLCNPGAAIDIPDLFLLGNKIPDILTGKNQPKIPQGAPEK